MTTTRSGGWTETVHHHKPGLEPEAHPLAKVFPRMPDDEYALLVKSIKANGLREPIWLLDGKILDGCHRHRACLEAGVKPDFLLFDEKECAVEFVVDANMRRRHLTESQRAAVAAELATTNRGRPKKTQICVLNNAQVAERSNVHKNTVAHARKVMDAAPELHEAVKAGELAVSDAAAVADRPKEIREKALEAFREAPGKTTLTQTVRRLENGGGPEGGSDAGSDLGGELATWTFDVPVSPVRVEVRARSEAEARLAARDQARRRLRRLDVVLERPRRVSDDA